MGKSDGSNIAAGIGVIGSIFTIGIIGATHWVQATFLLVFWALSHMSSKSD